MADESFEAWEFMNEQPIDAEIQTKYMKGAGVGLGAKDPSTISFGQHQRNFEEVVQAISEGREPTTSASEARKSVALIQAIYESARNDGRKVVLS